MFISPQTQIWTQQQVERTKALINLPFDAVLPLQPSLSSCLLSYFTVPSLPFLFFNLLTRRCSFSFLSLSLSLPRFPSEEINTISPRREKTNTDNPEHAAGMWRGLVSRFKWEHTEIIRAKRHMCELACPPGMKGTQIAGLHWSQHPKNIPQKGTSWIRILPDSY